MFEASNLTVITYNLQLVMPTMFLDMINYDEPKILDYPVGICFAGRIPGFCL